MKRKSNIVRGAAVAVVGLMAIATLMVPASAHINSPLTFKHLKKHFYTKKQSNARFINVGETATAATSAGNADKLDGADSTAFQARARWATIEVDATPRIITQTGGFSITNASTGFVYLNTGAPQTGNALQVTPQWPAEEANAVVCGGPGDLTTTCVAPGSNNTNHVFMKLQDDTGANVDGVIYLVILS